MATCVFTWDDINKKVEHVRFRKGGGDVRALEGASFVVFGVDPGAHCELCDEDVAAFGEKDGSFCRNHLDFRVCFHDFFDSGEGELMDFEVVVVCLEVIDGLLPVGRQDFAGGACQTLVDLKRISQVLASHKGPVVEDGDSHSAIVQSTARCEVRSLALTAIQNTSQPLPPLLCQKRVCSTLRSSHCSSLDSFSSRDSAVGIKFEPSKPPSCIGGTKTPEWTGVMFPEARFYHRW